MAQTADIAANALVFEFEEVPLIVGTIVEGNERKPLVIALISGECEIVHRGTGDKFEWDIRSITLSSPIKDGVDTKISPVRVGQTGHELWKALTESIAMAHADDIYEKAQED